MRHHLSRLGAGDPLHLPSTFDGSSRHIQTGLPLRHIAKRLMVRRVRGRRTVVNIFYSQIAAKDATHFSTISEKIEHHDITSSVFRSSLSAPTAGTRKNIVPKVGERQASGRVFLFFAFRNTRSLERLAIYDLLARQPTTPPRGGPAPVRSEPGE